MPYMKKTNVIRELARAGVPARIAMLTQELAVLSRLYPEEYARHTVNGHGPVPAMRKVNKSAGKAIKAAAGKQFKASRGIGAPGYSRKRPGKAAGWLKAHQRMMADGNAPRTPHEIGKLSGIRSNSFVFTHPNAFTKLDNGLYQATPLGGSANG